MTPINVWILNYLAAREHFPTEPTLAVRIFDKGAVYHKHNTNVPLLPSENWVGEVHSWFEDLDPTTYEINGAAQHAEELRKSPLCFTLEQAKELLSDFRQLFEGHKPTALMIHCNAGLNRSPGAARALCEIFNLTPTWMGKRKKLMSDNYFGNKWVYQALLEAAKSG